MTVSIVGGGLVALGLVAFVLAPRAFPWVLAVSTVLPATAAVTVGENSVAPFYVLAIVATAIAALGWVSGKRVDAPAMKPLLWFVIVAGVITLVGPVLFEGLPILLPRGGIDQQVVAPEPLMYTTSMIAQVGYLVLGVGVAVYLAQGRGKEALLQAAFVVGIGASTLRLVLERAGIAWPEHLLQNFASTMYNPYETRHHGIFPEPSYLGVFGIAACAYYAARVLRGGPRKGWSFIMLAASVLNLVPAGSGTALASAGLLIFGGLFVYLWRFVFMGARVHPFGPIAALAVLAGAIFIAWGPVQVALDEKLGSASANNRFGADLYSLQLVWDTYGLGVGLGANRPSSFATMLMSCVGVVGALLFGVTVLRLLRGRRWSAVQWTLVALLTAKVVAEPALSTPLLWLLIGLLLPAVAAKTTEGAEEESSTPERSHQRPFGSSVRGRV